MEARENVMKFLNWARELRVPESSIFSPDDLLKLKVCSLQQIPLSSYKFPYLYTNDFDYLISKYIYIYLHSYNTDLCLKSKIYIFGYNNAFLRVR